MANVWQEYLLWKNQMYSDQLNLLLLETEHRQWLFICNKMEQGLRTSIRIT